MVMLTADSQVEDILTAMDEITDHEELRKYIKRKLEDAYDKGYDDNQEQEF